MSNIYRITISHEDGNFTNDFNNLPDAEKELGETIKSLEKWTHTTFYPYDSHTSLRLFKDRKGRVIKIDKIEYKMRDNIENPYKVNVNHYWDEEAISADFVQEFFSGKLRWMVYLFSVGSVTPMRTVEFSKLNDCEEWAKNNGCDVWTYFGLDLEEINADMRIISHNHGSGTVIAYSWTEELVSNIASAYSLADIEEVISMLMNSDPVNCPNATFTLVHASKIRNCMRCQNVFVISDTMPDRIYCSEMCWQLDKAEHIKRDNHGNIIAGRMRDKVKKEYRPGQTIDLQSCLKKDTLNAINDDVKTLSEIEYTHAHAAFCAEIIFVDGYGNRYEYDGVCISEGKLKVAIKSQDKPVKIKRMYFDFEGEKQILPLNLTDELVEKIRKERECMPIENRLSDDEIRQYLNEGFTIHTFQASYCKEGHEFSPLADSK